MNERDTTRWVWRGSALAALLIGWVFIAWQNHLHITAPLVFVCLGYLAVVATVYNLWRTGAAAVAGTEDEGDSTWAKPAGALGELEREKRTLLKAIKEAEFDHQMGKLSQRDVDDMIRTYRGRAIEVIKEIDRLGHGAAGSTREQIMREVRARLELEARSQKKADPKSDHKPDAKPDPKITSSPAARPDAGAQKAGSSNQANKPGKGKKKAGKAAPSATEPATSDARPAVPDGAAAVAPSQATADAAADAVAARADGRADGPADEPAAHGHAPAAAIAKPEVAAAAAARSAAATQVALDDELNADSTTAVEPTRDEPAKEATP
jgi:hypothetical protein